MTGRSSSPDGSPDGSAGTTSAALLRSAAVDGRPRAH